MKKHLGKLIGILIILGLIIWGAFYFINNKKDGIFEKVQKSTEAEILLSKTAYPSNQREVVRLYQRLNKCCYNEAISEEQFDKLLLKMRELYDDELLAVNSLSEQRTAYYDEIALARKNGTTIGFIKVQKQSEVKSWTDDEGREYSSIVCAFSFTSQNIKYNYAQFFLRKDSTGKWKILGWDTCAPVDIEE